MKNQIDYILQLCRASKGKYSTPFISDGYAYSTNNFLMVRAPKELVLGEYQEMGEAQTYASVFEAENALPETVIHLKTESALGLLAEMSAFIERMHACQACGGSGSGECPHCGNDTECETCNGAGEVGDDDQPLRVRFNGNEIRLEDIPLTPEYLHAIVLAHVVLGMPEITLRVRGNKALVECRGGIQMVLMTRIH